MPWTKLIEDLNGEKAIGTFHEKIYEKQNKKN